MVAPTVSQHMSTVKEAPCIHLEFIGSTPAVLSTDVALRFQKKHQHVLRDIEKICSILPKSFYASNFGRIEIDVKFGDGHVRKSPAYLLTRDAFSLLVMGFTGAAAVRWKLKYIEAFNALETAALEHSTELARQAGYDQGWDEARALPAVQAGRQASYLEGMKEGQRLQKRQDGLVTIERALAYMRRGMTMQEAAVLTGCPSSTVRHRVARLRRALGAPMQGEGA